MSCKTITAPAQTYAPLLYLLAAAIVLSHSAASIVLGCLWLVVLWSLYREGGKPGFTVTEIILMVFAFWCLLTSLVHGLDWGHVKRYYYYTPLLVVPRLKIPERLLGRILIFFAIFCSSVILLSFSQKMLGFSLPGPYQAYRGTRYFGFTGHPIPIAGLYSFAALICLGLCIHWRQQGFGKTAVFLTCACILAFGVLLTESRTFYIAFIFASGLAVLMSGNRYAIISFASAMGLALLYVLYDAGLTERFMSFFDFTDFRSNTERLAMWQVGLKAAGESVSNLLFGIGFGGWGVRSGEYFLKYYPEMIAAAEHSHVHNIYLQTTVETGLVGLFLYISFMASFCRDLLRKMAGHARGSLGRAYIKGTLFCILCYLVAGLFDSVSSADILLPFYVLMSGAMALHGREPSVSTARAVNETGREQVNAVL